MALTLTQIVEIAATDTEFVPGMSSDELFYANQSEERLTDVIATVADSVLDKANANHSHTEYAPTSHAHAGYAESNHEHTGYAVSTHNHTQADITGLTDALATKADTTVVSAKADLVDGKVPASQLPAYVDDVLEYTTMANFPTEGETAKIYVDTTSNKTYRWSGSAYVEISASLALGETAATAYRGDYGKIAYDHSQNGAVHVTAAQKTAWDNKAAGTHSHSYNDLSDKPTIPTIPTSLPANGGNADTVDNKHASDFAAASHTHALSAITGLLNMLLTAEDGNVKSSASTSDVLAHIAALGSGMHTVYSQASAPNAPHSNEGWRFLVHKTGSASYGWVLAFGTNGSVYNNYLNNGVWRGWKCIYETTNNIILWSGEVYMQSTDSNPQVITPSKKLSECRTGWLLLWSDYDQGSGSNDSDFCTTFIPKFTPAGGTWGGKAFYCDIPMYVGSSTTDLSTEQRCIKPVYVHDDKLVGSYQNTQGGRNDVVLRAVYEI